jgi:hypothetical protein
MSVSALEMFFSTATQYYVAGRYAAFAGLVPVVGNLLHHAIEMYLKGGLSKSKNLAEVKKLSHDLPRVWREFKVQFRDGALDQFDGVVSALHAFEELRYPDSVLAKGMSCVVNITQPSAGTAAKMAGASPPQYDLCLQEVDKLVANIFRVTSIDPKFFMGDRNKYAKQYLDEENVESGPSST